MLRWLLLAAAAYSTAAGRGGRGGGASKAVPVPSSSAAGAPFCSNFPPPLSYSREAKGRQRKHAVCISGSRLEHLWDDKVKGPMSSVVFRKNDVDIFVYGHISPPTPSFESVNKGATGKLQGLFGDRLVEARIEDPGWGACEGSKLKEVVGSRASGQQAVAFQKIEPHVLSMIRAIGECDMLVAEHERSTGRAYKLVMRMRADLLWEAPRPLLLDGLARKLSRREFFVFPPHCYYGPERPSKEGRCVNMNSQDPEDGRIYFTIAPYDRSWFSVVSGAVVDQVFIGRSEDMHKVASLYRDLREERVQPATQWSYKPEVLLYETLRRHNLDPTRVSGAQYDIHRSSWHQTHQ